MPAGSFIITDPKIVRDAAGEFHIQKTSPAIDAAKGNYTGVMVDMDGQIRKPPLDTGADEFSSAAINVRILKPADVGHSAMKNN